MEKGLRIGSLIVGFLVVALILGGCDRNDNRVTLPETPVLSGTNRFVLVVDTYVRIRSTPNRESAIKTHARRGDVLKVKSRTPDEMWVEVQQMPVEGWVLRDSIRLYSSREQALNARLLLDL